MQTVYSRKKRNLVLAGLLVMALIIPVSRYSRKVIIFSEHSLQSALDQARAERTRFADSLKSKWAHNIHPGKTSTDTHLNVGDEKLAGGGTGGAYHIIIGSFTKPGNAKARADEYASKGYETNILTALNSKGENISMVSVSSFSDAGKAKSFLQEFHQNISPEAWLYPAN